jgi:DNA adenine methylase|tara:strand:- start:4473 stop:5318 length:846 start_codon:yes stop_codon:yes gene_type:complete
MKYLKTPLRYPGGKSRVAKTLLEKFPSEINEFREPFVGGGSVALLFSQKYPDVPIWINDKYVYLYSFWKMLQERGDELSDTLYNIKVENSTEEKAKELFVSAKAEISNADTFRQAVLFWILNKCSYSGLTENSSFSKTASNQNFTTRGAHNLKNISEIIQHWRITNLDYQTVMNTEEGLSNTFIFLDPPYKINTYLYGTNAEMHKNFNHTQFVEDCKVCPHSWLVTYNIDDELKEAYTDYHQEEFRITYGMKHRPDNKLKTELLVTNFTESTPLASLYETV